MSLLQRRRNYPPIYKVLKTTYSRGLVCFATSPMEPTKPSILINQEQILHEFEKLLINKVSEAVGRIRTAKDKLELETHKICRERKTKATLLDELKSEKVNLNADLKKMELEKQVQENQKLTLLNLLKETTAAATVAEENTTHLRTKMMLLDQERTEKQQEAKDIDLAHCTAIGIFKTRLQFRIDFLQEEGESFRIMFFRIEKETEPRNYFVELAHSNNAWKMLAMQPVLPCEKELKARLEETGDIQGFIVQVRNLFLLHISHQKADA